MGKVTIFVNNQLDVQLFLIDVYFYSLRVSDSYVSIIRRINCINTTSRHLVYVNLRGWPSDMQVWNQQVQTERTIPDNKPDILIRDKDKGTQMLVDTAITGERNVIEKEAEKILKYKYRTIEMQRMWNFKKKVIGVIRTSSEPCRKYLSDIPAKHKIKELQKKTSHIGHCTLQKVLM